MVNLLSKMIIDTLYSSTTIYTEENTVAKREKRPCFAIILKYEGETVYECCGQKTVSNASNMVILPQGSSYTWRCSKAGHFISLEFKCNLKIDRILSVPITNSEEILTLMKGIEHKRLMKTPMYKLECLRDAYSVILKLAENQEKKYVPKSKSDKLLPVIEYISSNLGSDIKNNDMADLIGVSTVYFRKLFTDIYGISPINYIKQLRIKKAKEMLRGDHGNISDIAFSLGYSSIYDFSRDFKKHTGVPPSKYQF